MSRFARIHPDGEERERLSCLDCGHVFYENPKVVVGAVVVHDNRVLLCRRAIEPQRGFCVTPISAAELRDLTGVRIRVEGACLERALACGDVGWESQLVASLHRLSRTPECEPDDPERMSEAWSAAHGVFHRALVGACDSPWLLKLREMLYDQSERYRRLSVPLAEVARDLGAEHRELVDAALARDTALVQRLLARHLETTTQILLDLPWPGDASAADRLPAAGERPHWSPRAPGR